MSTHLTQPDVAHRILGFTATGGKYIKEDKRMKREGRHVRFPVISPNLVGMIMGNHVKTLLQKLFLKV